MNKNQLSVAALVDGWKSCADSLPPPTVIVETKIDTYDGLRNVRDLERPYAFWVFPGTQIKVMMEPTHWRWKEARNSDQNSA